MNYRSLPSKDLYPRWRSNELRKRVWRLIKLAGDILFTVFCIALVIYISVVVV